jgi:hypothetical protein
MPVLMPISEQIIAAGEFKEKNRASKQQNHIFAIAEAIPALGWVAVEKTPAPHVKEMSDAAQLYTNRILKEFKDKYVILNWRMNMILCFVLLDRSSVFNTIIISLGMRIRQSGQRDYPS